MESSAVRKEVEAFRVRTAFGMSPNDCFPAWYLHRKHVLSEQQAIDQASDPAMVGSEKGYDFGLDAYHLHTVDGRARLSLVQAKYSPQLTQVSKGFRDLKKLAAVLKGLLDGTEPDHNHENKILVNLRRDLNRLSNEERQSLLLDFIVLHLCEVDHEIVSNRSAAAREELREVVEQELPDRAFARSHVGPPKMEFVGDEVVAPSPWIPIRLEATQSRASYRGDEVSMLYGIGRLSDLVDLYERRRDSLFSKNVRYFLRNARNTERGPAAKIRDVLHQMCITKAVEPELFAFYHNGVTIFARNVRQNGSAIDVQDPFVLNGCQTIKTAYMFARDPRVRDRLPADIWERVTIPVRITTTRAEALVQIITINNNRQNQITPAALRANDGIQLELEQRFRERKLFYERQEGALAQVTDTDPELLLEDYENSNDLAINIVDLARSIAAAQGDAGLAYALRPNDIFEHDGTYRKIFNGRTLASVTLLTFLQNLHDVMFSVLTRDLGLQRQAADGPTPTRVRYHAMALLVRYLAKKKKDGGSEFVAGFGRERLGKRDNDFRSAVRKEMDNRHSGIQRVIEEKLLTASDSRAETLREAFAAAERSLRLRDVDAFEAFADLDELEAPASEASEEDDA